MSFISFQCYACNQMLRVGADKAGRKAKCHKCGTILTIPISSTVPPTSDTGIASRGATPPPLPPLPAAPSAPPAAREPPYVPTLEEDEPERPPRRRAERLAPLEEGYDEPRPRRRRRRVDYEEEDYEEPERRPDPAAQRWRARLGLLLAFIGSCVLAGAFALYLVAYLLGTIDLIRMISSPQTFRGGTGEAPGILIRVGVIVYLGAALTSITGYVFCILGPTKRGMLALSIATTAVAGVDVLLTLIFKVPLVFGDYAGSARAPSPSGLFGTWFALLIVQLLFSAELILFPLYLRGMCKFVKARWTAGSCMSVMVIGCVYTGARVLAFIFGYITLNMASSIDARARSDPRAMFWITLVLVWIGTLVFLGFVIQYIMTIWRTRAQID